MIAEITAGYESIKAATNLLKGLNAASTEAQINDVKIGLQRSLLDAQQGLFAAQQADAASSARIRDLERQIAGFNSWESEKDRFELRAIGAGAFAYVMKASEDNSNAGPWYCSNCFENGKKSIYQKQPGSITKSHLGIPAIYDCSLCSSKIAP
jgi:hypothetical protein